MTSIVQMMSGEHGLERSEIGVVGPKLNGEYKGTEFSEGYTSHGVRFRKKTVRMA